jgi:hypothetical protein
MRTSKSVSVATRLILVAGLVDLTNAAGHESFAIGGGVTASTGRRNFTRQGRELASMFSQLSWNLDPNSRSQTHLHPFAGLKLHSTCSDSGSGASRPGRSSNCQLSRMF